VVGILSVAIILGSKSDLPVARAAGDVLKELGIPFCLHVASAHRSPGLLKELVERSSAEVFIGIAGLSAALPGAIASHTSRPVIGVPVSGKVNLDAILSIVQMPPGIPVAAVGLDSGANAAILAAQILALKDPSLAQRLAARRSQMLENVLADSKEIENG
jgi:5-(carboxyamino)imidazole ribonucleotide mutase